MSIWDFLIKRRPIRVDDMVKTQVKDIMKTDIVYVSPESTIPEAIKAMRDWNVNYLIIMEENEKIDGVITDGDILYSIYKQKINPENTKISEIMTKDIVTLKPEESVKNALEIMIENKVRRLPIVEKGSHLVGLVSMTDIEEYAGYNIVMKI
jgi:CBS domain-containing protein